MPGLPLGFSVAGSVGGVSLCGSGAAECFQARRRGAHGPCRLAGTKAEEEAKKNGAGVLLISEDLDELLTLSDRVVVAYHGNISAPMLRRDVTVEKLGLMMMGRHEDAKQ